MAVGHAALVHRAIDVGLDGADREDQVVGDLLIAQSASGERRNLCFPMRELDRVDGRLSEAALRKLPDEEPIQVHYGFDDLPEPNEVAGLARRWSPSGNLASSLLLANARKM